MDGLRDVEGREDAEEHEPVLSTSEMQFPIRAFLEGGIGFELKSG